MPKCPIQHCNPALVAVVTGGASGIGLAAASRFVGMGLRVCVADLGEDRLAAAADTLIAISPGGPGAVMTMHTDVARLADIEALHAAVEARFGGAAILMNNAGIAGAAMFGPNAAWERVMAVNLWGVIHGSRVFAPGMIARGTAGLIINTGSKQGITTPPGDPAYNVTKAGIKAFTEALQHELRTTPGCSVSADLLIPGFVFTGLTARNHASKPDAAWTAEQTVDFMLDKLAAGDFYILCPDNDVARSLDERRILWAAGDIVENRPPLSRWHPDFKDAFQAFADGQGQS